MSESDQYYVCIHGHFYQPPRESPWLEAVEPEDSAYPYHDWNVRIAEECYGPNAAARILDGDGRIRDIVNNYARLSFNFGPTLLSWLEEAFPDTYGKVVAADRLSRDRFSGHGSAMAQAYNHIIMPLATRRDRQTQIAWGVKDFEHRFGRFPEGMWLPETAVDMETLSLLAEAGIRFTVLSPHQAAAVRPLGEDAWQELAPDDVDTSRPYLVRTEGGDIAVFFYSSHLSRAVAFEHLLDSGSRFAAALVRALPNRQDTPALSHIATDGETYGHHHRFGEMALAFALEAIEQSGEARLTNYAEFLSLAPPTFEARIRERTSWSCAHGVARWEDDCGCTTGGRPGWRQKWRRPLRDALDGVRDQLAGPFEELAGDFLHDPWAARDDYIHVILDRSPASIDAFLDRHGRPGAVRALPTVLKLMELQRYTQLMYTSCGFFFDDISRIETVQVMKYVARASQLGRSLFGIDAEGPFVERLRAAKSNVRQEGSGASVYLRRVKPLVVDLPTVAGHYAVSSLFEDHRPRIYCYLAERPRSFQHRAGAVHFSAGTLRITSEVTRERSEFTYAALHFGEHHVSAGVRPLWSADDGTYDEIVAKIEEAFSRADLVEVTRTLSEHFTQVTTSLRDLFPDEQRRILAQIVDSAVAEAEDAYRSVYARHVPLMRFMSDLGQPLPRAFGTGVRFVLQQGIYRSLGVWPPDAEGIAQLLADARQFHIALDDEGLALAFEVALERLARDAGTTADIESVRRLTRLVLEATELPVPVTLWKTQNALFEAKEGLLRKQEADLGAWEVALAELQDALEIRLEGP